MKYTELTLPVSGSEEAEIRIALLSDWPFESFSEEEGTLKAYIPSAEYAAQREEIDALLRESGQPYTSREIEETNWNAAWEAAFEPIEVDGRCLIRAPFHAPRPGIEFDLEIMPKMSFGTGHHATTHLMVGEILRTPLSGLSGLDMGSGTGVLAILAAKAGAVRVDAVDIDEWAYENCGENIAANGVEARVIPYLGDAALLTGKRYDFILANINRNILLRDMPVYVETLAPGGILILSGILREDIPALEARARELGLSPQSQRLREEWAALKFNKL